MLTPLDHWLRDKFLLQTHVYTMRLPEKMPKGVKARELPDSPSNKYRYRLISNSGKITNKLVKRLGEDGMMFTTHVIEKKTPLKGIISPKGGSFLLTIFWMISFVGLTIGCLKLYTMLAGDAVFVENLKGAIEIFTESGGL